MISKERFNNLAINLSHSMDGFDWDRSDIAIITESGMLRFAHALLKAVEAESEVVLFAHKHGHFQVAGSLMAHEKDKYTSGTGWNKLIALPLVSEE